MGFRYRKSINLGGGFRINLSKSGVGYSWGIKGYRVTKTAKGNLRRTISIPGTGISHVSEISGKKNLHSEPSPCSTSKLNEPETKLFTNADADTMSSSGVDEILARAQRAISLNRLSTWCIVLSIFLTCFVPPFFLLLILSIIMKVFIKKRGIIDLEYEITDEEKESIKTRMKPMNHLLTCDKVWRITQATRNVNKKYSGGASSSVARIPCKVSTSLPFPFKASISAVSIQAGKETFIFLPDKLLVMQAFKIGALSYEDIQATAETTRFIENDAVPKDAEIVGSTWKYINKSGGPDKRFKDNKELPICLYGELNLTSTSGLNTSILFSNPRVND